MAKSETLYARIEPDIKEQAEEILAALGIPASNAIGMFYRQIILHGGLPFDVKIPKNKPVDVSAISTAELDAEIEKGMLAIREGRTRPVSEAFGNIREKYGI